MYSIIEWVDSKEVSAVPSNWLLCSGSQWSCYWPSSSLSEKAMKNRMEPNPEWPTYHVRLLGSADTYEESLKKSKVAMVRSDLSAEESLDIRTRHHRYEVPRSDSDSHGETMAAMHSVLPKPPVLPTGFNFIPNSAVDHHSDGSGNRSAPVSTPVEQPATVVMPLMTTSQLTSSITGVVSTAETPLDARSMSDHRYLVGQLQEMKSQLFFNTQLLQEIVRRQRGLEKDKVGTLPASCVLPLQDFDAVLSVEQQLKSKEFYSQLVSFLTIIGGATIKDFVSRVMTKLLGGEFAKQFVWAGRLTAKHPFKQLELKNVVFEATRKNPLTSSASVAEVDEEIKTWLRGAPDRNGGRCQRSRKMNKTQRRRESSSSLSRSRSPRMSRRAHSSRHGDHDASFHRSRSAASSRESSQRGTPYEPSQRCTPYEPSQCGTPRHSSKCGTPRQLSKRGTPYESSQRGTRSESSQRGTTHKSSKTALSLSGAGTSSSPQHSRQCMSGDENIISESLLCLLDNA